MANVDLLPVLVPESIYKRVFQQDGDGVVILEELSLHFYDQDCFAAGHSDQTAFNLGQRSVVQFLMKRAAEGGV